MAADLVTAPIANALQETLLTEGDEGVREAVARWSRGTCPACGNWPALAEFFFGERLHRCAYCAAAWRIESRGCTYCGEHGEHFRTIPIDRGRPGKRLEVCRRCGGYLKTIDVASPAPFPLLAIEDFATADLDRAAVAHGFRRTALQDRLTAAAGCAVTRVSIPLLAVRRPGAAVYAGRRSRVQPTMVVSELLMDGDVEMLLRSVPMLCLAFAVGCGRTAPQGGPGGAGAMPPADVKMVTLSPKPVPRTSEFVASIRSLASTTVQPQVEGIVTRVLVRSGDRVRAGQPLVQIDPDKQQASVSSLEANRAARQADVAYAHAAARPSAEAVRGRRREPAGTGAGADRRATRPTRSSRPPKPASGRAAWSWDTTGWVRRRPGSSGDVPVRTGDRVTTSTVITTIDSAQGLEAYVSVPLERAADLRLGFAAAAGG